MKSISLVLTRFNSTVCPFYFFGRGDKTVLWCQRNVGTYDETWVSKVFVLLLTNNWNQLYKFVYITTKLYICSSFHKRLPQKQTDWQKSGCEYHIIFKEDFVVWRIVLMLKLGIVVFSFLCK